MGEITHGELLSLKQANDDAKEIDQQIAKDIQNGLVDGIILASADPEGANQQAIEAAVEKELPIVGTGGTSMAITNSMGENIIATSGTTGTTNRTRAISSISHLAKHWGIKYNISAGSSDGQAEGNPFKK
ncbi:MAG TPA: hypothetical protein VK094_09345 [Pseudogracilibacillus sp.]|nr:hypothetical protein [Pseudogracilibacillus sp.]